MAAAFVSTKERSVLRRYLLRWAFLALLPYPARADVLGRVYVYAQRSTPARSWVPVSCGGAVIAALKEGRFFAIMLPPGRYTVSIEGGVPRSIEVQPGADLYLRLDWDQQVGRPPIPVLSGVRAAEARREMGYLSYIDSKHIRSESVPKHDPREPEQRELKRRQR